MGLTLSSVLLLTACGQKEETPTPIDTPIEPIEDQQQALLPSQPETTMTCPEAIQAYLDAANLEGEGETTVQANDAIIVDYIGRLADGTVFDTSVENVAINCGTYVAQRNYNEGLQFVAGTGQMIPGFDAAVVGMKVGQTKTVTLAPEEAY